jgi:hypothetical protein
MMLPDFIEFELFNRLRRLMNAPLPEKFSSGYTINRLTHDDLDKALEGIEGVTVDDISELRYYPTEHWAINTAVCFSISVTDGPFVNTSLTTICLNFM